jgi:GNAT superfamily N-acetyltransferase
VDSDLSTALAAERAIVRRAVAGARDIDGGWIVRHPPLPDVWHLNRVHLTGRPVGVDADLVEALAAHELADVSHRRVTLDDAGAADALWSSLEKRGWRRERSAVLVRDGRAPARQGATAATRLDEVTLGHFQRRALAEDAQADASELPALIAETQSALRRATAWRAFGAGAPMSDPPASTATLYLDPDVGGRRVAFVDQVATLRAHRERGLAHAVVAAALAAAADWDAGLVALFADADDWPQVFYASLGFVTVGRQTVFHR